jgi:hypothetical protein
MKKPLAPARDTIAPSDLTFAFSTCKRCLWLKYWFKLDLKKEFPLLKTLSTAQEESFRRAPLPSLDPSLPDGVVKQWGQWLKSAPLVVNGVESRFRILGIYDLLGHYTDGSVAIIDCKVSDSDRDNGDFYAPQLEAYAYALEHPDRGVVFPVKTMGLLVWKLAGVAETTPNEFVSHSLGFGVHQHYVPVPRDPERLQRQLADFLDVIESDMPAAGADCNTCNYLIARHELEID